MNPYKIFHHLKNALFFPKISKYFKSNSYALHKLVKTEFLDAHPDPAAPVT
jgi:hypothetical protein